MALADVVDAVAALLPGVAVKCGAEFVTRNDAPPRVIFVPSADEFPGAARQGPAGVGQPHFGRGPRPLKTRAAGVDIHVWAAGAPEDTSETKDLRATEALLHRVVAAIHRVAHGSYRVERALWPAASDGHHGRLAILSAVFLLPVLELENPAVTTATITTFGNAELTSTLDLPAPSDDPTGSPAP